MGNLKRLDEREQLARYITGTVPPPPDNLQTNILEGKDGDIIIQIIELSFEGVIRLPSLELMIPPAKITFRFLTNWNHREWAHIAVRRGYIGCLYAGADIKDDTEEYSEIW